MCAMKNEASLEIKNTQNWSYYYLPALERQKIYHGFFTKDSPLHIMQEKEKEGFLHALSLKDAVVMHQEHGDKVHVVQKGERPLTGDGIILLEKGVAGVIKTADCLPVILCDPFYPMAAIVHAGWRGTAKRITEKAIRGMAGLGAKASKMIALLGPSINACCYKVGEEVYTAFRNEGFSEDVFRRDGNALFCNLRQANREAIIQEGIRSIYDINLCTLCNESLFYSFRRGETEKRQINFVSLAE